MPRKKLDVGQWGCSLPIKAREDLKEVLRNLDCLYNGQPSLGVFLTKIWKGELVISKKVKVPIDDNNL